MIHESAIVSPKAKIGSNVTIGAFSFIYDNVIIGDGTSIDSYCEIGYPTALAKGMPLIIGAGSKIRSRSTFYEGAVLGENLVTGHSVVVREGTRAGDNLQIGSMSDIQGQCDIGHFVKMQSYIFIAQGTRIGNYVWLSPGVMLTNDPHPPSEIVQGIIIEDFAAIAARSIILPGVTVGTGALVGANSLVSKNVDPDTVVLGSPACFFAQTSEVILRDDSGKPAYPWRRHFHRGYPASVVQKWLEEFKETDGKHP